MAKYLGYFLPGLILVLAVLGARLQSDIPLFIMLGLVIAALLLMVFNRIEEKQYPILIYFITLGMVYQLTLLSNYVVGTDIHYEYYYALQTYNTGHWDYTIPHSYNAAMSVTVFLPFMAKLLHIPLAWAFKIFPPLFLSGIPVVAYYIFKREFNSKAAFLGVFFFISVPTMFLELSGLAKQAIGELFLVLCLGLIAYNFLNLKKWLRYALIVLFGMLTIVSHYSMGGALFCYLGGALVLFAIGKYLFKLKPDIHLGWLTLSTVIIITFGVLFYGWAAQGNPLKDITGSARIELGRLFVTQPTIPTSASTDNPISTSQPVTTTPTTSVIPILESAQNSPTYEKHWQYPEATVAVALGADFASADGISKTFRVFQFITEGLVIIGVAYVALHFRKYSLGYLVFTFLSCFMLGLVIFFPGFSPILNASRFYNLALLFLAPMAIVSGRLVLRSYKALAILVFVPYFIFTSGAVFELVKIDNVSSITVPYSHALSAIRTDSTAVFTDNDIKVRDWLEANNKYPIYGDMWGATAMSEVEANIGKEAVFYFLYYDNEPAPRPVPKESYLILRERNTEKQEVTYYVGVGLRRTMTYEEARFTEVLKDRPIIYQAGDAVAYGFQGE